MKLIIDISEEEYKRMIEQSVFGIMLSVWKRAIKNGTPLPKGHGKLIDADALYDEYVKEPEEFNGGHSLMALFRVAPTIIEADKAESKLDGDPIDIDKAVEHYEGTLETLKGIDLEVDG